MRILYLTQWFDPEPNVVKGVAFVRALSDAGHDVTVVTGLPNYPTGKLYPGYRLRLIQREIVGGIEIVRLPLYPSHDHSSVRRSLNFLSFFLSALLYCLFRRRPFDLAYVYHPPITVGAAAALSGLLRRLPFVLDVQDLWPDTIAATGMPGAGRLVRPLGLLCAFVYRRAANIIVQSDGMRRALLDRGVESGKVTRIFNWANLAVAPVPRSGQRSGPFRLVYAGNLGKAQGLATLLHAAAAIEAHRSDVEIHLYGDGVEAGPLRRLAADLDLSNLRFHDPVPAEQIVPRLAEADALLMLLADDPLFAITIPSKTQFYLAMGRPIVAAVAGEAAELLRGAGMATVAPGDSDALARAIREFADLPPDRLDSIGREGRRIYQQELSFERGMAETLAVIEGTYAHCRQRDPIALS